MIINKITFWKIVKPNIELLLYLLLFLFLMGSIMYVVYHRDGYVPNSLTTITICVLFVFCIPQLILSINYFNNDRRKVVMIDIENELIIISRVGIEKKVYFKDITRITRIGKSLSKLDGFVNSAPWKYFYYYKIELLDNSLLYLSCFAIIKLENLLPKLTCKYLEQNFPIIKTSS